MKLSIIIPVYNAEKYLPRCLDSILTIQSVDWECILIDDGSTDKSWDIICEYTKISSRFIARHKENGGVSSARNAGLKICTGDRVMFVDSDDYLFLEADQMLHEAAMQYGDYDMILFKWADAFPDGARELFEMPTTDLNNPSDWIKEMVLFTPIMSICWSRLFKYSVIDKNGIQFNTSMRVAEDGYFVCEYLKHCNTIAVVSRGINQALYAYYHHQGSAIRKFYKKDIFDELQLYKKKLELAIRRNVFVSPQEKARMNGFFWGTVDRYIYGCANCSTIKEFKSTMSYLVEDELFLEIIENCDTGLASHKERLTKFMIGNKLFCLCWCVLALYKQIRTKA